jgi:hypothetical protein
MTQIHRDTIMRLSMRVGEGCARLMDEQMRNLNCERLQLDELWAFVGMKQKRASQLADRGEFGDSYTFVALDADTKLVPCFRVGRRTWPDTDASIRDLRSRVNGRVQITTDAFAAYYPAIREAFSGRVDYAAPNQSFRVGIEHRARALLASDSDRIRNGGTYRKPRRSAYLDKFCRAPESIGADGNAVASRA